VATTEDPSGASVRLADDAALSKLPPVKSQVQSEYTPKGNELLSLDGPPSFDEPLDAVIVAPSRLDPEVIAWSLEPPSFWPLHDATTVSMRLAAEWKGIFMIDTGAEPTVEGAKKGPP
jgi:hypothetical protein